MEHDTIKLASLLKKRCDVVVFCKKKSFIHQQLENMSAMEFVDIRFSSRKFSPNMLFSVRRKVKEHKIKNVIFFGASELKTLYFSFLGLNLNVIVRHGTTKSSPKKDLLHRMIYSCVNIHVALSKHLLNNIKLIVPDHPGVLYKHIPQSFKFSDVQADNVCSRFLKIVHVGRVTGGKGQIDAILACKVLHDHGIKFNLAFLGSYDDNEYYEEAVSVVNASAYAEVISFMGHVTNVSDYLANSDLLLFPSLGEGMPNALIEALHYGVVCITYDNTVFPEFLEMGFNLHLVETGNIFLLSKTLHDVATNIESEKNMAFANVRLAKDIFKPESELHEWFGLLV